MAQDESLGRHFPLAPLSPRDARDEEDSHPGLESLVPPILIPPGVFLRHDPSGLGVPGSALVQGAPPTGNPKHPHLVPCPHCCV